MKINIEIHPATEGSFADTFICQEIDGEIKKVQLNLSHFHSLFDFTKETSSVSFDFFLISAIIYGVDDLLSRKLYSFNGWTREIEVELPVVNIDDWQNVDLALKEALSFLTGDNWVITFRKLDVTSLYKAKTRRWKSKIPKYNYSKIQFVSLFSGGLDSLIGVINELDNLRNDGSGLLVSHFDPAYSGPKNDQNLIGKELRAKFQNKFAHIRSTIGIVQKYSDGTEITRDTNQRSRSILFIGIATYVINKIPNLNQILIPENGTISLNHPLTKSRYSSLSTRTTHPYFLSKLERILELVGVNVSLINPFELQTKGKMVIDCSDSDILEKTYLLSVSCGKRGHKRYWEIRNAKQCGICMPCIYRRAALHKAGLDNGIYGNDFLKIRKKENARSDVQAFFDYLSTAMTIPEIKRNLLVNGTLELSRLNDYAALVHRSREEILSWVNDKGSEELKKILKIHD